MPGAMRDKDNVRKVLAYPAGQGPGGPTTAAGTAGVITMAGVAPGSEHLKYVSSAPPYEGPPLPGVNSEYAAKFAPSEIPPVDPPKTSG